MNKPKDRIIVMPAMRGGLRPQKYYVSREYAEILVAAGKAYWDPAGLKQVWERSIQARGHAQEWRKRNSGGAAVMQLVPIGTGRPANKPFRAGW